MMHDVRMDHFSLTAHLSPAEISALRLQGEVNQHGELWDEVQNWQTRSRKILQHERHPVVLTGVSAVWAMGLCVEPYRHTASTVTTQRIRRPHLQYLHIEERTLTPSEYWLVHSYGITRPLRTCIDLLKMEVLNDQDVQDYCRKIMKEYQFGSSLIVAKINDMTSVPNKRLALNRAKLLDTYPSETR